MQNKWLWGCGIGCGVLIVLVGLAGLGAATYGIKAKDKAMAALTERLRTEFDRLKGEGKIPAELQEPVSELITLVQRPGTPMVTTMVVTGVLANVLSGKPFKTELALPAIVDLRDLLKEKPAPTMDELNALYDKHKAEIDALEADSKKEGGGDKSTASQ